MTIFGNIVTSDQVEAAVEATLRKWFETYLAELERQTGRDPRSLHVPRSYQTSSELTKWNEKHLPAVLIISPGLYDQPSREGKGKHRAHWALGVAVVVSAAKQDKTRQLAGLYAAVVRAILLQRPSLGGFAQGVSWLDEKYDDLDPDDARGLAAGQVVFSVDVRDVTTAQAGPVDPSTDSDPEEDPYEEPLPIDIEEVDIDVNLVEELS